MLRLLFAFTIIYSSFCFQTVSGSGVTRLLNSDEVIELLSEYSFERELKQWHIHHTWDPHYADFSWENHVQLQEEMRSLHVDQNGWDDIGQHLTLFPDGKWMLGRSLQKDPASIRGWNTGAIAVEMVGNFDTGHDIMTPMQEKAILILTAWAMEHLEIKAVFHRDHPKCTKTCPGSGINRDAFFKKVNMIASPREVTPQKNE